MKEKISLLIAVIITVLLSSCSIVKRHYGNGYYVSHHSKKQVSNKENQPLSISKQKINSSLYTAQPVIEKNNPEHIKQNLTAEKKVVGESNKNTINKTINNQRIKKYVPYYRVAVPVKEKEIFNLNKPSPDSLARDALSLFWIVILVLLILWLVAILTGGWGLGGFVYLLLVIALILLILWLLRII